MKILRAGGDPESFFGRLRPAPRRVLFTDFDGTLAPFQVDREDVSPYPGVVEALDDVRSEGVRVVVVSGRAARDVDRHLGLHPRPEIWGSHGREQWSAGTVPCMEPLDDETARALERVAEFAAGAGWADAIERKPAGIAFHWRGREAATVAAMRDGIEGAWRDLVGAAGLELHAFDGGLELRPPDAGKGDAVRTVLEEAGPGTIGAYLGDDATDEPAFLALRGKGLAVQVGPEARDTAADLWLRPPGELLWFLHRYRDACAGRPR